MSDQEWACCKPWRLPRGETFHSKFCKVSPGEPIEGPPRQRKEPEPARAGVDLLAEMFGGTVTEERPHDWNACVVAGCAECAYIEHHIDDQDDWEMNL